MPIARFQMPDGRIGRFEVPEGTTPEQAQAMIAASIASNPPSQPVSADPTEDMSTAEKVLAGAGKAFVDVYRGGKQLLGIGDQRALQQEIDDAKKLDAPLMNTGAGKVGNFIGNAATALPTAAIPGANTLAGAALLGAGMGALNPVATGESRLANAGVGSLGGAVGAGIAKGIGRITNPVQSQLSPELQPLATRAKELGIPLDAADVTGSRPLKVIRSVMESLPLTADKQAALNEVKRAAFNRAALAEIGETADKATPEVLNAARQRIGNQFDALTSNKQIPLGDDFLNTLSQVDASITPFSSPSIRTAVDKGLELAQQSPVSGRDYQKVRSVLGSSSSDAFKGSNSELGQALKKIRSSLDEAATKALTPEEREAWRVANRQWQNLKVLERAAAPTSADAVAGNVSPAKLAQALMAVDKKGLTYGTRGDTMADLARIGQAFVKDQIPNSGTAERTLWTQILTGNPIESLWQLGMGGISKPVQSVINSKAGQKYLSEGLIPLNDRTRLIAQLLRQGAAGGVAALPLNQQ